MAVHVVGAVRARVRRVAAAIGRMVRRPLRLYPTWGILVALVGIYAAVFAWSLRPGLSAEEADTRGDWVSAVAIVGGAVAAALLQKRSSDVAYMRDLLREWLQAYKALSDYFAAVAGHLAARDVIRSIPVVYERVAYEARQAREGVNISTLHATATNGIIQCAQALKILAMPSDVALANLAREAERHYAASQLDSTSAAESEAEGRRIIVAASGISRWFADWFAH